MASTLIPPEHEFYEGRTCNTCKQFKTSDNYYVEKAAQGRFGITMRAICIPCTEERKWRRDLFRRYGITYEDYTGLQTKQDHKCAICGSPEAGNSRTNGKLFVDHCHTSGKVRGLLCSKCNHAIGLLNDDTDLLRKSIKYLNSHKENI